MMKNIETARCQLELIQEIDYPDIFKLYQDKYTRAFLGGTIDETTFQGRFSKMIDRGSDLNWIIRLKESDSFIGMCNITDHHDDAKEISYQFLHSFWAQGLAKESVGAVIKFADEFLKLPYILAETQEKNYTSCELLKKLGMNPIQFLIRFNENQIIYRKDFDNNKS